MKTLTETDLAKGLDALQAVANQNNVVARRTELLNKANDGSASTEEREELIKSLSGNDLQERVTTGMRSEPIAKSIDVSDFLKDITAGVVQGLEVLAEQIQKSQVDESGFRVALATTLAAFHDVAKTQGELIKSQGELLKSLTGQADANANQAARQPKSRGLGAPAATQAISKSFGGAAGTPVVNGREPMQLTDNQIYDAIEGIQKGGTMHINGEDLTKAVIKFESLRQMTPAVMAAVQEYAQKHAS